jgi:PAS domain S-box-containing protein
MNNATRWTAGVNWMEFASSCLLNKWLVMDESGMIRAGSTDLDVIFSEEQRQDILDNLQTNSESAFSLHELWIHGVKLMDGKCWCLIAVSSNENDALLLNSQAMSLKWFLNCAFQEALNVSGKSQLLVEPDLPYALFEATLDTALLVSLDGVVLLANRVAAAYLADGNMAALVGKHLFEIFENSYESRWKIIQEVIQTGVSQIFEDERRGFYFQIQVSPILDQEGRISRVAIFGQEVTARKLTEIALKNSEKRYREFVETLPTGFFESSIGGTIMYANSAFRLLLSGEKDNLIGDSWLDFAWDDLEFQRMSRIVRELRKRELPPTPLVFKMRSLENHLVFARMDWTYQRNEAGNLVGFLVVVTDVTEHRKAAMDLAHSERRYREFVETVPVGLLETDTKGRITFANQYLKHMFELNSNDSLTGRHLWDLAVDEADARTFSSVFYNSVRNKELHPSPLTLKQQTFRSNYIDTRIEWLPKLDAEGDFEGYVAVVENVTEKLRARQALQDSEQRLEAIVSSVPDPILMVNDRLEVVWCNQSAISEFGSILSQPCSAVFGKYCQVDTHHCMIRSTFAEQGAKEFEHTATVQGEERSYLCRSNILKTEDENTYVVVVAHSITERLKMEKMREKMAQADKMISLGTLVSGVGHEINNPNHIIMSHASPLKDMVESILPVLEKMYSEQGDFKIGKFRYSRVRERILEMLDSILMSSRKIKSIVDELKDYARQKPSLHFSEVSINLVLKSAITLLKSTVQKATENFEVLYGENIPAIYGNYQRLEQVVMNLIQNSAQALKDSDGMILVKSYVEEDQVVLMVEDSGCGMAADTLRHIMDPFYTTKRETGGLGLGLSISSGIVLEHGGTLEFDSTEGSGTRAYLRLPFYSGVKQAD